MQISRAMGAAGLSPDLPLPCPALVSAHNGTANGFIGSSSNCAGAGSKELASLSRQTCDLRRRLRATLDQSLASGEFGSALELICFGHTEASLVSPLASAVRHVSSLFSRVLSENESCLGSSCASMGPWQPICNGHRLPQAHGRSDPTLDGLVMSLRVAETVVLQELGEEDTSRYEISVPLEQLDLIHRFHRSVSVACMQFTADSPAFSLLDVSKRLDELKRIILLARTNNLPQIIPPTPRCGIFCEATLEARTGLRGAGVICNTIVLDSVESWCGHSDSHSKAFREVYDSYMRVQGDLINLVNAISQSLKGCPQIVGIGTTEILDRKSFFETDAVGMTVSVDLRKLVRIRRRIAKLLDFQSRLTPIHETISRRIVWLQSFLKAACNHLEEASDLPPPFGIVRDLIFGGDMPLVTLLVRKIRALQALSFGPVLERLLDLFQHLEEFNVASFLQSMPCEDHESGLDESSDGDHHIGEESDRQPLPSEPTPVHLIRHPVSSGRSLRIA